MNSEDLHFHGTDVEPSPPDEALFHVIPVPYEKSTSYGKGTADGPRAILDASQQLELFDGVDVPAESGICTCSPVSCEDSVQDILERIAGSVSDVRDLHKIPVILGGEHTVTVGALRGLRRTGIEFGVIQFDAHADLRAEYEGSALSHACAMRHAVELHIPLFQIGVRSLSLEEESLRAESKIPHLDARSVATEGLPNPLLPQDFPDAVYVTFDIDALDPSIMPSTGTPEPGGLTWYTALNALEQIAHERTVVGFDVVELAPIQGLHAPDFTTAKLIYSFMGMIARQL